MSYTLPEAVSGKSLVLTLTMTSNSKGSGQVYWQEKGVAPAFSRERSKPFEVSHDGEPHRYSIEWSADHPVAAIRIDPSTGPGKIRVADLTLTTEDGQVLHRWKF